MATEGLSTGKTILIGTIVLGCFAVLWPKIFVPMLFGPPDLPSKTDHPTRGSPDGPNFVHPALRSENFPTGRGKPGPGGLLGGEESPFYGEEGRHIRKAMEFKPGPVPGMRPSMGGHGMQPPTQQRGQGTMGVLMPIYTIGIVIFFLYTVMKIMFKKDNEQEEAQQQQQHHKVRAAPHQYGQQYRDIRMRHFQQQQQQQQQQRMQQMHNVNLHQQQYQKSAPLPVIPEMQQQRNVLLRSENVSNCTPTPIKENSSNELQKVDDQTNQKLEEVGNEHTAKVSNVMENLLNVAESVINLREPSGTPIARTDILCDKEDAMNDPRDDEIATLRKQLEETQRTMEQIIAKVGNVSNEVQEPIGMISPEKMGQQSVAHSDHYLDESPKTEDGNIKTELLQPDISGRSTPIDIELRNQYTEIPSSDCMDDTAEEKYKTENIELQNVFEDTGNEQSESNSSNDSLSTSNCTSEDDIANIGVSELGAFQSAEIGAERFDEQYTEEECSDSDEEVDEYVTKHSDDEPIYQDESQYPFYDDKRHYSTSDHFNCDEESDEYDYQEDEGEEETRNANESLNDKLRPIEENTCNCLEQSTQCHQIDESLKEAKDITSDSSPVSDDQNDEDEATQSQCQVDSKEWDDNPSANTTSRESSLDHPLVSNTVQDDELTIDSNQENKQQLPENNHTQDTCHAQNDIENPNTSQRHRKDVELIVDHEQHSKHQLASLSTSRNGRNRRRKRLRKT